MQVPAAIVVPTRPRAPALAPIAVNRCLKVLGAFKKRSFVNLEDFIEKNSHLSSQVILAPDHLGRARFELSLDVLRGMIEGSTGTRGEVAKAFYLEEKSVLQISCDLGLNTNTVLSHLRRFRIHMTRAMLELIEEEGIEMSTYYEDTRSL